MDTEVNGYYILDENGNPEKKTSLFGWAIWMGENNMKRMILKDYPNDHVMVSTVFLGIDHSLPGDKEPLLFETMIFEDGKSWDYQERYSTREKAIEGHKRAVAFVFKELEFRH